MDKHIRHAESVLAYAFAEPELLRLALTHASIAESTLQSNERLEFLGDAILGLIVCELIYKRFPSYREGEMTKVKSMVVSRETCAQIARDLGLEKLLILGKGMQTSGEVPPSLAAAAFESVIGALYLDAGFEKVAAWVTPLVVPVIERAARSGHQRNFKSVLQQYAQQSLEATPCYRILDEQGPDHAKCFKIAVEISGRRFEACWGQTKKKAEQEAALAALRELGLARESGSGELVVDFDGAHEA